MAGITYYACKQAVDVSILANRRAKPLTLTYRLNKYHPQSTGEQAIKMQHVGFPFLGGGGGGGGGGVRGGGGRVGGGGGGNVEGFAEKRDV